MILLSYDLDWRMPWSTNGRKQSCHFLLDNFNYLNSFNEIIIYYDNVQNLITKILNGSFAVSGLNYKFKKEVIPGSYRLFQVADFVSTIKNSKEIKFCVLNILHQ